MLTIGMKTLNSDQLLAYARDPGNPAAVALAGVIASGCEPCRGIPPLEDLLGMETFKRLMARYFPGLLQKAGERNAWDSGPLLRIHQEHRDLVSLLFEHGTVRNEETLWLAQAVAAACMGGNHLWQDMGLPNRTALSDLLARCFRTLYEKNTGDMKWKKFFYKQLCEREGMNLCKSPNCEVCTDYSNCFGSEEDSDEFK